MSTAGEFARLAALAPHLARSGPGIIVGVGDDAAVVAVPGSAVVACVDTLVEGVHFRRDISTPDDIGWKAIAANVSDLAAMGAVPVAALVSLQRPPDLPEEDVQALYAGMGEAAADYGLPIVGGDTVDSPTWAISVTALGRVGPSGVVTRAGAAAGDLVVLVGWLGAAATALDLLGEARAVPPDLLLAHRRPVPLLRAGQAVAAAGGTAMIDLSDGLGADAMHVARASGVALHLDGDAVGAAVHPLVAAEVEEPRRSALALGGGEDYALLACIPPDRAVELGTALDAAGDGRWGVIGRVEQGDPAVWLHRATEDAVRIDHLGWAHG